MNFSRGNFYRVCEPVGHLAARRFTLRRFVSTTRSHTWRRMLLRWRRKRAGFGNIWTRTAVASAPAASSRTNITPVTRASYFRHFHLHFVLGGRDRSQHKYRPIVAPHDRPSRELIEHVVAPVVTPHSVSARQAAASRASSGLSPERYRAPSKEEAHVSPRRIVFRTVTPSRGRAGVEQRPTSALFTAPARMSSGIVRTLGPMARPGQTRGLIVPRLRKPAPSLQIDKAAEPHSRRMPSWEYPQRGSSHLTDVRRRHRSEKNEITKGPEKRTSEAAANRERGRELARITGQKSAELVWRRTTRTSTEEEPSERNAAVDTGRTPTETTSQSPGRSAPDVERLLERATAKQMTQLDPALLDRLTDNVISRLEKRIKIERQRRGL